jgi:hypothetical protein
LCFKNLLVVGEEDIATTEEVIVRLDNDVRSVDFERLLAMLYPRYAVTLIF